MRWSVTEAEELTVRRPKLAATASCGSDRPNGGTDGGAGRIKVTHVITGLETGGAEMMLYNLLSHIDRSIVETEVVSMTYKGSVGEQIEMLGIPVRELGMERGSPNPWYVFRLAAWLRKSRPNIVQTWMYHANLVGGVAAKLIGGMPVVWGIHASRLESRSSKRLTMWTVRASARLSASLPARIVCASRSAHRLHVDIGYDQNKMRVIPNGFDLDYFAPDRAARVSVRRELNLGDDATLIGMVARVDPQKDHGNFINAAALLRTRLPNAHFLLCGSGVTQTNPWISELVRGAGIGEKCHLLGKRDDIPRLTAALDVATTASSYGEAFPLVIGEAMACGVPCVVTDVGDSAYIVGETGRVVPVGDPHALAMEWLDVLGKSADERCAMGKAARARIISLFSVDDVVVRYQNLYLELLGMPTVKNRTRERRLSARGDGDRYTPRRHSRVE
jgi:glycosyltransferase involved in cell wall biosynthesis